MKLLVTGAEGQLGSDLIRLLPGCGISCVGAGRQEFDVTDRQAAMNFISEYRPDAVIHCASYNAVDRAEDEPELCFRVNAEGTAHVAAACGAVHAKMMYISTDYVFGGEKAAPYEVEDPVNPLSVYGRSKVEGEKAVRQSLDRFFIVRTSWLFGRSGNNFVKTMLRLSRERDEISVVNDQIGSPTYSEDLARLLLQMIQSEKFGIYHATNEEFCSWADFAQEIMRLSGSRCQMKPVASSEYPAKAIRPKNSRLSKAKLVTEGFYKLPTWQEALRRYLSVGSQM